MSVTTTTSTTVNHETTKDTSLEETLRDYALHYSESSSTQTGTARALPIPLATTNPSNWPTRHRRIPPHRPINRNLDLSERPNGSNRGELLFVTVMMNGVRLQSVSPRVCLALAIVIC